MFLALCFVVSELAMGEFVDSMRSWDFARVGRLEAFGILEMFGGFESCCGVVSVWKNEVNTA